MTALPVQPLKTIRTKGLAVMTNRYFRVGLADRDVSMSAVACFCSLSNPPPFLVRLCFETADHEDVKASLSQAPDADAEIPRHVSFTVTIPSRNAMPGLPS